MADTNNIRWSFAQLVGVPFHDPIVSTLVDTLAVAYLLSPSSIHQRLADLDFAEAELRILAYCKLDVEVTIKQRDLVDFALMYGSGDK